MWALNVRYTLRAKLASFESREEDKDFYDIFFLTKTYADQVAQVANTLKQEQRKFFVDHENFQNVSQEERLQLAKILGLI